MSKAHTHRELYAELKARQLLEYGCEFLASEVQDILGIAVPVTGTKAEFDALSLLELSAVDYVRNILLGEGKYLTGTRGGYRVLLPSENAIQIEQYVSSADRKLNRALKLSRNTPEVHQHQPDQTEARIAMKRNHTRHRMAG